MKKALAVFAFSLLMLTSCTVGKHKTDSPVDPNVFYLDSLPDIGEFKTYDSGLEAPLDFVPSNSYGEVLPYVGSYRIFETPKRDGEEWHAEQGYASFGLMTPDGRVVMKASDKNTYINYSLTDDGFGFYTLTREIMPKDDAPDEYMPSEIYIIPRDGSWCLELENNAWVSGYGGGCISVCVYPDVNDISQTQVVTHLYGYDGKLINIVEGSDSVEKMSSGLMLVSSWTNDGYEAYFVDVDGNNILGPYSVASDFNEAGITGVQDENGAYLVNTDGERITEYYDSIYKEYSGDMKKHVFSARHRGDRNVCDVFSQSGEFIGTTSGSSYASFRFPDNGRLLYYYTHYGLNENGYPDYKNERMIWRYVDSGESFVTELGKTPNSYTGTDNCYVYLDEDNKKGYLIDGDGKTIGVLENASEVVSVSPYGEYAIYVEGEYSYDPETGLPFEDTRKTHIYSAEKGGVIYSTDSYSNAYFPENNDRFVMLMHYDRMDMYDMLGGEPEYSLFDTKKGRVVLERCEHITMFNLGDKTVFNVVKGNTSLVLDEEMNVMRREYFE